MDSDEFGREDNIDEEEISDEERRNRARNQSDFQQSQQQNHQRHTQNDRTHSGQERNTRSQNRSNTQYGRQSRNLQNNRNNSRQQYIQLCNYKFYCGHRCEEQRHKYRHKEQYCPSCLRDYLRCEKILSCGHQCQQLARVNPCPPCEKEITKVLECDHSIKIKCKNKDDEFQCNIKLSKQLPCNHEIRYICKESYQLVCNKPCERLLQCQHKCQLNCNEDCSNFICKEKIFKQLECLHQEWVECYNFEQNFHDFCEDRLSGKCCDYYDSFEEPINQSYLIKKYNQFYQTQFDINIEIKREVGIELFIFKQLFKDEIEIMQVGQNFQGYQRKLIRYLQRNDIYDLINKEQFKFVKDLTLKLIKQHYMQIRYEIEQLNEYTEIQQYKMFNYYLGKMICKQKLICGHQCEQFFHLDECICQNKEITIIRQCGHKTITECHNREYKLLDICNEVCKRILPCEHYCQKLCNQECKCEQIISINQKGCDHMIKIKCGSKISSTQCYQMKTITFINCQHQKQVLCYDQKVYMCKELISHICKECKNETKIKCQEKNDFKCNKKISINLKNCVHQKTVLCQDYKKDNYCQETIDHICSRCNNITQITCMNSTNYQCYNRINVTYDKCTHYQQVLCYKQDLFVNCSIKVTICQHQQNIECYKGIASCQKICGKLLQCNHTCKMICNTQCICNERIIFRLQCGHTKEIYCNEKSQVVCEEICNKKLNCKHLCKQKCTDNCKCLEKVEHIFSCGHKIQINCGEQTNLLICQQSLQVTFPCNHKYIKSCKDQMIYKCQEICNKTLNCKHQCLQKCTDQCICLQKVIHQFSCGHKISINCGQQTKSLICQQAKQVTLPCNHKQIRYCKDQIIQKCYENCNKQLNCKHLCLQKCSDQCKCLQKSEHIYPCGHKISLKCGEQTNLLICQQYKNVTLPCSHTQIRYCNDQMIQKCEKICNKTLNCKHLCKQKCSDQCKCLLKVEHQFSCWHKKSINCGEQTDLLICQQYKNVTLPCNHSQIRYCKDKTTQQCKEICNKTLSCGDQCKQQCQEKCKCQFEIKKTYPCLHSVEGCSKQIQQDCQKQVQFLRECGHQILKICSYQMTICQEKCNKILQCKHICQDICGNKCEVKCNPCKKQEEEQKNFLFGSIIFQQDFQLIQQQDATNNQPILNLNQICNKILKCNHKCPQHIGQKCRCNLSCIKAENDLYTNKIVKYCPSCKQEQIIICGGQLQCKCNTLMTLMKTDKNQKSCNVILSCNHICRGVLCTTSFHELCNYQTICQHQQYVYCSGRSACQLCDPYSQQQQMDQQKYYFSNYTIKNLPSLKNAIYEKNRILFQKIATDDKLKYMINNIYYRFLQQKLENLIAFIQEDKKIFLNISKYSKMEKIEQSDFYLTSQQLKNL